MSDPSSNPLRVPQDGPLPQFSDISDAHFSDAFDAALAEHLIEIEAIAGESALPTFENTVEAMERAGAALRRVADVFFNIALTDTTPSIQAIEREISPRLASHNNSVLGNAALFARVDGLHATLDRYDGERRELLVRTHRDFVRAGASLGASEKARVQAIDELLATLTTRFAQNLLQETNDFELLVTDEESLDGLPDSVRQAAASEAMSRDKDGFLFTLSRSSITPFLQYSSRRDLRELIYKAYTHCGDNDNAADNKPVVAEIVLLRQERAGLMGFGSHADFKLDNAMAGTPARVHELLDAIWEPAKARVAEEAADLEARIQAGGGNFKLAPWDWFYYTEKVRAERYAMDPDAVKPYFLLQNVMQGAFDVAKRLYGVRFDEVHDLPLYHPDVKSFAVSEADGGQIGWFLVDYFMRPSKRGGAWMSSFQEQSVFDGGTLPVVINCCNFPKADPCLLGMDEVRTLFHEFGHGLHGLLSKVHYRSLSGTSVKRDFVELPSQIMEHWAVEPEVMRSYARHCETGDVIPDELIDKLRRAGQFNQGFATTEYLAASYLDLHWHSGDSGTGDAASVNAEEAAAMRQIELIAEVDPRYRSTYFQHIFASDGYAAGYYAYIWAEVLDADAFQVFADKGIFDAATAASFREHILSRGGTDDPMALYQRFRGQEPTVAPLLAQRGLSG